MAASKAGELRDRGFTLIELLVACGILAALAYTAWGGYAGVQASAEDDLARAELRRLADALRRFQADTGYYPGQGPFALAAPGTVETANATGGYDCAPTGGLLRSWARPYALPDDGSSKDAWFKSPANLALLFEAPALCANHPLARLQRWDPDSRRGWHGPYLDPAARKWVDHGADFNASAVVLTAPDGTGNPLAGEKLADIPAFGAGPRYRAAGPSGNACDDPQSTAAGNTCMLGWREVPRETAGYAAGIHELKAHARPFAVFGLANGDFPRVVYWGRDGKYGGRNLSDPCTPNLTSADGADDQVLCLRN